jgi:hypothetical protein
MAQRPTFRKREIVFAVAMGALAAGAGAMILDDSGEPRLAMVTATQPTRITGPFSKISTVGPQDVIITIGDTASVRSEGDPKALSGLKVVVEDGELTIGPKEGFRGGWGRFSSATFYVTVPWLEAISLAGSGSVHAERVSGARFTGLLAGPGELAIDALEVDQADFTVAGSGHHKALWCPEPLAIREWRSPVRARSRPTA